MARYVLWCAALCILPGCVGSTIDEDAGATTWPGPDDVIEQGPCTGEECTGRRPHGAGCEEDRVGLEKTRFPARRYGRGGKVESPGGFYTFYYSPSCQAKWVQVYRDDAYYSIAWLEADDGSGLLETVWDQAARGWTSSMLYTPPGTRVRACVRASSCAGPCDSGGFSTTYCSDYR